jgi:hypothetical protein
MATASGARCAEGGAFGALCIHNAVGLFVTSMAVAILDFHYPGLDARQPFSCPSSPSGCGTNLLFR